MTTYPFSEDRAILARFWNEYQLSEQLAGLNCTKVNDNQFYLNVINAPTTKVVGWFDNGVGTYVVLPAKQGVRYLIQSIHWSVRLVAPAGTTSQCYCICNSQLISAIMLRSDASGGFVYNGYDEPNYLCPVGKAVNCTIAAANVLGNYTAIRYSEVKVT
jgi:hypothetical protein